MVSTASNAYGSYLNCETQYPYIYSNYTVTITSIAYDSSPGASPSPSPSPTPTPSSLDLSIGQIQISGNGVTFDSNGQPIIYENTPVQIVVPISGTGFNTPETRSTIVTLTAGTQTFSQTIQLNGMNSVSVQNVVF